jgi:hypothetical protein
LPAAIEAPAPTQSSGRPFSSLASAATVAGIGASSPAGWAARPEGGAGPPPGGVEELSGMF